MQAEREEMIAYLRHMVREAGGEVVFKMSDLRRDEDAGLGLRSVLDPYAETVTVSLMRRG
jgi:hypothetical protein